MDPSKQAPQPPMYSVQYSPAQQQAVYQPQQQQPPVYYQPAGAQFQMQGYPPNVAGAQVAYSTQQPQQVVVIQASGHHLHATATPKPAGEVFKERIKTGYGFFRLSQLLLGIVTLGLYCGFLSYAGPFFYYWLWTLIMPFTSICVALPQLFNYRNFTWSYGGGGDIAMAIFWGLYQGVFVGIFWFYFYFSSVLVYYGTFYGIMVAAPILGAIITLTYWICGCSACCCHCMDSGLPR